MNWQRTIASGDHARRLTFVVCTAIAVAFLALHLPFLPASLEDVDSINFALGLRRFDVAHHQPHPPGYPVFIALGHLSLALFQPEAHALAALSVVAGALAIFPIVRFYRALGSPGALREAHLLAAAIAVGSPLYWFTSARPLSDATGLAAALSAQAMAVAAFTPVELAAAAVWAGAATGIRSQVASLTVPLIVFAALSQRRRAAALGAAGLAFAVGVVLWAAPLIVLSGGLHAVLDRALRTGSGGSERDPDAVDDPNAACIRVVAVLRVRRAVGDMAARQCCARASRPPASGGCGGTSAQRSLCSQSPSDPTSCSTSCSRRRSRAGTRFPWWCRLPHWRFGGWPLRRPLPSRSA